MTYRSLQVLLDQDPRCEARMKASARLAKTLDCHLVGVAPTGFIDMPVSIEAAAFSTELIALSWDMLRDQAEKSMQCFVEQCHAAGVTSFETVIDECDKAASLVRHAHCSDLSILTQADPQAAGYRAAQAMIEQVVLYSARPTLLLPYAGCFESIGRRAMVAWDDSREAARAVSDALPLLRRAESVQVLGWNEGGTGGVQPPLGLRLDALRQWLMWQGVLAEVREETAEIDIAAAMLSRAADIGADLIVMGAYGHGRLLERVLGGATRGLLSSMTVPVLMSH